MRRYAPSSPKDVYKRQASGNANTSDPRIAAPADYDKVVAVAAIEADYRDVYKRQVVKALSNN